MALKTPPPTPTLIKMQLNQSSDLQQIKEMLSQSVARQEGQRARIPEYTGYGCSTSVPHTPGCFFFTKPKAQQGEGAQGLKQQMWDLRIEMAQMVCLLLLPLPFHVDFADFKENPINCFGAIPFLSLINFSRSSLLYHGRGKTSAYRRLSTLQFQLKRMEHVTIVHKKNLMELPENDSTNKKRRHYDAMGGDTRNVKRETACHIPQG